MRILQAILSEGFYGSERYCIELAVAQARAGHAVTVLSHGRDTDCGRQFAAAAERVAHDGSVKQGGSLALTTIPRWTPAILQRPFAMNAIRRVAPEIVHSHLNPAARRVGRMAQRHGIPHVLTLHLGYDANEHSRIDGVIALSSNQRGEISEGFSGQVATVWNWLPRTVETALERVAMRQIAERRAAWQADDKTIVFGSIGRLMPEKGMDWLIEAFRKAFPAGTDNVRLVVVGEGDQRPTLERLGAGDRRVILTGQQTEIASCYRAIDVFVSAARYEPFSLAIIEAMGAGCRLIATRIYGTLEFVTDSRALWVNPDNIDELAVQLRAAASVERTRFNYDMTPFQLARASAEIEDFYRRLITPGVRST